MSLVRPRADAYFNLEAPRARSPFAEPFYEVYFNVDPMLIFTPSPLGIYRSIQCEHFVVYTALHVHHLLNARTTCTDFNITLRRYAYSTSDHHNGVLPVNYCSLSTLPFDISREASSSLLRRHLKDLFPFLTIL